MKFILLVTAFMLTSYISFSQDDISDEELYEKYGKAQFGPNKKNYLHTLFNVGLVAGESSGQGADIEYGKSHSLSVGLRYRFKFHKRFSVGLSLQYKNLTMYLKQDDAKLFPNNVTHESEKLSLNNIDADLFYRINISTPNKLLGSYFDLGGYFGYAFYTNYQYTDNYSNVNHIYGSNSYTIVNHNPNYIRNTNYGLLLRYGYNYFEFFVKYNLSGFINDEYKTEILDIELPKIEIGIGLNI